jgi:YbgC/YbaW family acyl-CoA thioester hydrolase
MLPGRPMPYRYARRVQFAETDQAGIVHFSWYFRYMEEAEHALWRAAGLSIAPPDRAVVFPRVAASCEYLAPLRFEDEFEVEVGIDSIGRRSIRYVCTITRGTTRIATGSMTVAAATRTSGEPLRGADVPDDIAVRLRDFGGGPAARSTTDGPALTARHPHLSTHT